MVCRHTAHACGEPAAGQHATGGGVHYCGATASVYDKQCDSHSIWELLQEPQLCHLLPCCCWVSVSLHSSIACCSMIHRGRVSGTPVGGHLEAGAYLGSCHHCLLLRWPVLLTRQRAVMLSCWSACWGQQGPLLLVPAGDRRQHQATTLGGICVMTT
jgi:hypothetical protein